MNHIYIFYNALLEQNYIAFLNTVTFLNGCIFYILAIFLLNIMIV